MRAHSGEGREPSASILSRCLVEGDAAAAARARRAQRKALVASLGVEAAVLAALVLVPLLAIGRLPEMYRVAPLPPYGGTPHVNSEPPRRGTQQSAATKPPKITFDWKAPTVPQRDPTPIGETTAPDVGPPGTRSGPPGADAVIPGFGPVDPRRTPPTPPQTAPQQTAPAIKRSEGVQQALLVRRIEPSYPILARQAGVEGTVRLHAVIGRDGTIRELEVLSGHPLLVNAARDAVREWRYQPTLLNGEPVEVETYITVVFQLRR